MMKALKNVGLLTVCCLALSLMASPCFAAAASGESPWMVRVRALGIFPDVSSSQITQLQGEVDIDDAYTLDLDISYFFTENIALELTLAYVEHDVSANGTIIPGKVDLGSLDLLPPTLTLQYHFMPKNAFRPYIGAGVSYVLIPDYDAGPIATSIDYENGNFGVAIQFGFDYFFNKNWCLNVDVKKVWVSVDATVYAPGGIAAQASVDVDPWLVGVGIGYRF